MEIVIIIAINNNPGQGYDLGSNGNIRQSYLEGVIYVSNRYFSLLPPVTLVT